MSGWLTSTSRVAIAQWSTSTSRKTSVWSTSTSSKTSGWGWSSVDGRRFRADVFITPCNFDVSKNVFTFKLFMKISFTKMRSYQFIIQSRSNSISSFNPCKHSFASKNSNQTFKHLCGSQWPSGLIRQFEKKRGRKVCPGSRQHLL